MAEFLSPEEVIEHHKKVLGEEFGLLFNALHNELVSLYIKWQQFKELFSTNQKRIELMNEGAPIFFQIIQFTLLENIVLNLARLVESKKSSGKENLSLQWLPTHVTSADGQAELQALVDIAKSSASFATDWRHRHIAHRDLAIAIKHPVEPLATVNTIMVEQALKAIEAVLAWVNKKYFDSQFLYDETGLSGDARSVLSHIREGLAARKQRFERMKNGTATEADYDFRGAP